MTTESKGRQAHEQSRKAIEDRDFVGALKYAIDAMEAYREDNDLFGFSEILSMTSKIYTHLRDQTGFKEYIYCALASAKAAADIAESTGDLSFTVLPLYNLAQAYEDNEKFEDAVSTYNKSLDRMQTNPPAMHNRPAFIETMKVHAKTCEYKSGNKDALQEVFDALSSLETAEGASDYERAVWLSGGHMRVAFILKKDNPELAKEHLAKAKEIIDRNPELVIRKEQFEKLASMF